MFSCCSTLVWGEGACSHSTPKPCMEHRLFCKHRSAPNGSSHIQSAHFLFHCCEVPLSSDPCFTAVLTTAVCVPGSVCAPAIHWKGIRSVLNMLLFFESRRHPLERCQECPQFVAVLRKRAPSIRKRHGMSSICGCSYEAGAIHLKCTRNVPNLLLFLDRRRHPLERYQERLKFDHSFGRRVEDMGKAL